MTRRTTRTAAMAGAALLAMCGAAHAQAEEFESFTWAVIFTIGAIPFVLSIPIAVEKLWQVATHRGRCTPAA